MRHPRCDTHGVSASRSRTVRLVTALTLAIALASALIYTSFSASTEARTPSQVVRDAKPGESYELTGTVVKGSVERRGDAGLSFRIRDRAGSQSVPVSYSGLVPDPFREGREVIVTGELRNGTFVAEPDSLVTKCPSKFTSEQRSTT
jgi:cytochrome c-type biogenesis protein CcmE